MKMLDFSIKPKVRGAKFWSSEINQLYRPLGIFGADSKDIVYSKDTVNKTKFLPVLLKEWFYLVRKGGYLIVDYKADEFCNFKKLEDSMWWLWKGKYDIIYHGPSQLFNMKNFPSQRILPKLPNGYLRFTCKKLESTTKEGDSINKWTFGIITKGERGDWLEEIIQSIHNQKIPKYEIIICGTYKKRKEKNFSYIHFSDRDDRGWITKKKNLILKKAKYENICMLHDRMLLDKNWFKGMKKYGNCFEILSNIQILKGQKIRAGDWLTYGRAKQSLPYNISKLDYDDWDEYIYISGQLTIIKKSIWKKFMWNETLYWGEEDVEFTFRAKALGYLPRFNTYSSCTALTWRFGNLPTKYYRSQGLIPKDMLFRRFMRIIAKVIFTIPYTPQILSWPHKLILKTNFYRFLLHH